jgi:hypothetical protein
MSLANTRKNLRCADVTEADTVVSGMTLRMRVDDGEWPGYQDAESGLRVKGNKKAER